MQTLNIIWEALPTLLYGLLITIEIAFLSIIFGLIIGLIFGLFHISNIPILKFITEKYIDIIRGVPLMVQVLFIYFGLPSVLDIRLSAFTAGLIAVTINAGAYLTEIFRAGINSVDKGQMEAGRSLGLSYATTMRLIILPQGIRHMIPAFVNQFIITIKDTSILMVVGVAELTMSGQSIYAQNFRAFEILFAVGVLYYFVVQILSMFSRWVERRLSVR